MSQISSLDRIVRRLVSSSERRELGERLVVVDAGAGKVLNRPPFWTLGRDIRFFAVSPVAEARCEGPTVALVEIERAALHLRIHYLASCQSGREADVALAFARADNPARYLNTLLEHWAQVHVRELREEGLDPTKSFTKLARALSQRLRERAEQLGLNLEVAVRPDRIDDLKPWHIRTGPFTVRPIDCEGEIPIDLEVELTVEAGNEIAASLHRDSRGVLEDKLRWSTRDFVAAQVRLHELWIEQDGAVRTELTAKLAPLARAAGREIRYLRIRSHGLPDAPRTLSVSEPVKCKIKDSEVPVLVRNDLLLTLKDLGKYWRSGVDDLRAWAAELLTRVCRGELFEQTYLDLHLSFAPLEESVKRAVGAELGAIGYEVQHHLVIPDLEALRLRTRFELEVEGTFKTLDTRMDIALLVDVRCRIPDLSQIPHLIRPEIDIVSEMRKAARSAVERVLNRTSPQEFYLNFRGGSTEDSSVAGRIVEAVTVRLQQEFGAADLEVTPKPKTTELTDRIAALMGRVQTVEFDTEPIGNAGYGETVRYSLQFQVVGIADWGRFLVATYTSVDEELGAIENALVRCLVDYISKLGAASQRYTGPRPHARMVQHVVPRAVEQVALIFGLHIHVWNVQRAMTPIERERQQLIAAHASIALEGEVEGLRSISRGHRNEHQKLSARVLALLDDDGVPPDYGELAQFRTQRDQLAAQLTHRQSSFGGKMLTDDVEEPDEEEAWQVYDSAPTVIGPSVGPQSRQVGSGDTSDGDVAPEFPEAKGR